MLEKHYSPSAALTLFEGPLSALLPKLVAAATAALVEGQTVGVIAADEDRDALTSLSSHSRVRLRLIGRDNAPDMVAARLYSTLRELDAQGTDVILVRGFGHEGLWAAVRDRLRRAAAGRIIQT
jgi:L-threonylcarbamoyladenylate synthase